MKPILGEDCPVVPFDLGTLEIYHNGTIESRSNCLSSLFATPGHLTTLNVTYYLSLYQMVDRKNIHFCVVLPKNPGLTH